MCFLWSLRLDYIANFLLLTAWKVSKYSVISGPYFPVFGLNTEINGVNLRIQSEYKKTRTRINSVFGHFSRSGCDWYFTCTDGLQQDTKMNFVVNDNSSILKIDNFSHFQNVISNNQSERHHYILLTKIDIWLTLASLISKKKTSKNSYYSISVKVGYIPVSFRKFPNFPNFSTILLNNFPNLRIAVLRCSVERRWF